MSAVRGVYGFALAASLFGVEAYAVPFAYVLAGSPVAVSIIDTTTNTVTTTVPLAEPASGVAVNRAGSRVYLAGYRGGAPNGVIQVLDTTTNTIAHTVTTNLGRGLNGVTVNSAGTRVYAAATQDDA